MTGFIKAASALILLGLSFQASALSSAEPIHAKGVVYRVIDGDTFEVNLQDEGDYLR